MADAGGRRGAGGRWRAARCVPPPVCRRLPRGLRSITRRSLPPAARLRCAAPHRATFVISAARPENTLGDAGTFPAWGSSFGRRRRDRVVVRCRVDIECRRLAPLASSSSSSFLPVFTLPAVVEALSGATHLSSWRCLSSSSSSCSPQPPPTWTHTDAGRPAHRGATWCGKLALPAASFWYNRDGDITCGACLVEPGAGYSAQL